jgi:lariat debranching enzyme
MPMMLRKIRVAVQGCSHGSLDAIYASLKKLELNSGAADVLLLCGDFQAVRNRQDLDTLHCPQKYRVMGDFSKYYSGLAKAPLLTVFIGGNHEAASHMWELYHGGWVAPNIYYMGHAGVIRVDNLRIAGISGIHSDNDAALGYEPLDAYRKRGSVQKIINGAVIEQLIYGRPSAAYHTRQWEIERLFQLKFASQDITETSTLDIFLSHEWPHSIYEYGNVKTLLEKKPFFRSDLAPGSKGIGSMPLAKLLSRLKPKNWYAAHMHVDFEARVKHTGIVGNESSTDAYQLTTDSRALKNETTKFVALDKCLPGRVHLKIFDIPTTSTGAASASGGKQGALRVEYDPEWLAIIRAYNPFMPLGRDPVRFPSAADLRLEEHRNFVRKNLIGSMEIPGRWSTPSYKPGKETTLAQTAALCKMLGMRDYWNPDTKSS